LGHTPQRPLPPSVRQHYARAQEATDQPQDRFVPHLFSHLNVYNTALVVLERKGWALRYDTAEGWWFANKGEWEFLADDPMQLLGLVAIYKHHSPKKKEEYWWKIDQPDLLAKLDPEVT
jgi:hypothetical protein